MLPSQSHKPSRDDIHEAQLPVVIDVEEAGETEDADEPGDVDGPGDTEDDD